MSEQPTSLTGRVAWTDLTVPDAESVRDFYMAVVGWSPSAVNMGDYDDFAMVPSGADQPVAGICHQRGPNTDLPPQWLIYITVADLDASIDQCERLGGSVIVGPKSMGGAARYCVIRDPSGAVAALYQDVSDSSAGQA